MLAGAVSRASQLGEYYRWRYDLRETAERATMTLV
jgi:hypothetical protein